MSMEKLTCSSLFCLPLIVQKVSMELTPIVSNLVGIDLDDFISGSCELLLKFVEDNYALPEKPKYTPGEDSMKELERKQNSVELDVSFNYTVQRQVKGQVQEQMQNRELVENAREEALVNWPFRFLNLCNSLLTHNNEVSRRFYSACNNNSILYSNTWCEKDYKDWKTFITSREHHNQDAKVVDLSKCLFGWDVKIGKRDLLESSFDDVKVNKVPNSKYYFELGRFDLREADEDIQEAANILVLMAHDHQLKAKSSITTQSKVQAINGLMCLDDPVTPPTVESGAQVEELMATSMTERNLHVKELTDTISGEIKGVCDFDLNKLPTFEDVI
nr:zinc finger C2H2-type/integrase DNA-binding domain-containing protein [Tanacetum cinerariifolium]